MTVASLYAERFYKADDDHRHQIGVSNFRTNRALVFAIEAAKSLCGAEDEVAARLLRLASGELEAVKRKNL